MFAASATGTCTTRSSALTLTRPDCCVDPPPLPGPFVAIVVASASHDAPPPRSCSASTLAFTSQTLAAMPIGTCAVTFSMFTLTSPSCCVAACAAPAPPNDMAPVSASAARRVRVVVSIVLLLWCVGVSSKPPPWRTHWPHCVRHRPAMDTFLFAGPIGSKPALASSHLDEADPVRRHPGLRARPEVRGQGPRRQHVLLSQPSHAR